MNRDQLLTPRLLNQCYTFLLECSHSCKNYTSIITDRFLATKYPLRHESFPFYVEFFFVAFFSLFVFFCVLYWMLPMYQWIFHSGRDRMVVGFTTTYAISAYHHWCCEFEPRLRRGVQHYVIRFVSDLRQVGGFLRVLRFPLPIKLTARI